MPTYIGKKAGDILINHVLMHLNIIYCVIENSNMIANQTRLKQIWPNSSLPAETAHGHRHTSRHSPREQVPYPCILHE